MDTARIAHPAHRPNTNTREHRALDLARRCFEEIAASHRGGRYTVPASGGGQRSYDVTYTARQESCECLGWQHGHVCYHVQAVAVVRAKTGICAGCGRRFRHRELLEVEESLTFFEGDVVCEGCARAHGVL